MVDWYFRQIYRLVNKESSPVSQILDLVLRILGLGLEYDGSMPGLLLELSRKLSY